MVFLSQTITIRLKSEKKTKKKFQNFDPKKIAIFGQNLKFSAKNGHFWTKIAIYFSWPKIFFDGLIFLVYLELRFKLSYAPLPQYMWSG